jgi:hypothetical protein
VGTGGAVGTVTGSVGTGGTGTGRVGTAAVTVPASVLTVLTTAATWVAVVVEAVVAADCGCCAVGPAAAGCPVPSLSAPAVGTAESGVAAVRSRPAFTARNTLGERELSPAEVWTAALTTRAGV